ncbi:MAG: helix-turn-helix transcriptional regulator [Acidobacteriota bacterium]
MKRTVKRPKSAPLGPKPPVEVTPGPDIGRLIRMFRASKGMTQKELEKATGVHRSSLSAYETGWRRPRPATFARIMTVVGSSRPPMSPGAAAAVESLAERVWALAGAAFAEVAARLAAGLPPF